MCGLWTRPWTDVDPPRFLDPWTDADGLIGGETIYATVELPSAAGTYRLAAPGRGDTAFTTRWASRQSIARYVTCRQWKSGAENGVFKRRLRYSQLQHGDN